MYSKHGAIWEDGTPLERVAAARKEVERLCAETDGNGNTIVRQVPCGVHPLHTVNVRRNGSRSGCPMCEMAIEDLTRSMSGRCPRNAFCVHEIQCPGTQRRT